MLPLPRRTTLTSVLAGVLCAAGLAAAPTPAHAAGPAAAGVTLTVAHSGAQFSTVQSAVDAVPDNSATPYTISIAAGTYAEYLTVPATKLHLTMLGATGNPADVRIDGSRYNGLAKPGGGTYGTEGSATVHVKADGFTAEHLTFRNLFSRQANPSVTGTQAVALAMEGDRQTYLDCDFYGHQDTLLSWNSTASKRLRSYVRGGEIDGDVDFIFGNGTLVVDRSRVNLLSDDGFTSGYLAAPATFGSNKYGILLTGDTVTSTFAAGRLYLGRAWKPSADAVPQMVVRETSLPAAIRAAGPWTGISGATWTPGRYGEYANTGPGATVTSGRPQLSAADAASYTAAAYLAGSDGWNPTAATAASAVSAAAYPNPGHVTGDTGVHDPSTVKRPGGGYLVAYTGNDIGLKTSQDRIAFRNTGTAFPNGAPWTYPYTGNGRNLWAPDVSYRNGQYYMYYAASTFGSNHSAVFLATSPSGDSGSWTNRGLVVASQSSDDFNAIDPNLVVDAQGRWWLDFGSFWSGIKMVALDPATGLRADSSIRSLAGRGGGPIEAPFVFHHGSYYYLFVSFDYCCRGAASTYRIMVGRSTSATGSYTDRNGTAMTAGGGTEILAGHGSIHGPGGEGVFADTDHDILDYHYYADSGASFLGLNFLTYDTAGWPYVS